MICKKCNSQIPDNSAFCLNCGKAVGKDPCPKCQHNNDEGTAYCLNCGYRLDGKVVCKCGITHEPNVKFCPDCGENLQKNAKPSKNSKDETSGLVNSELVKKIITIITISLCLAGILLLFIACFTPLFSIKTVVGTQDQVGTMFHHYFFKMFKTLKDDGAPGVSYLLAVFTLILILANFTIICLMLTFAAIRFTRYFVYNEDANLSKYLQYALLSSFTLALWINCFNDLAGFNKIDFVNARISIFYILALIFSFIFLLASVILNIIFKSQESIKGKIVPFVLNNALPILVIIFLCMINGTVIKANFEDIPIQISYTRVLIQFASLQKSIGGHAVGMVFSIFLLLAYLSMMFCGIYMLIKCFNRLVSKTPYKVQSDNFVLSIINCSIVILALILAIVIINIKGLKPASLTADLIISIVFAVLILGTQIANKIYLNYNYE